MNFGYHTAQAHYNFQYFYFYYSFLFSLLTRGFTFLSFKIFFFCCIFSYTACLWSLSPLDFFTSIIFCFVTFVFPLSASSPSPEPLYYHLFSTCLCLLSEVEYLQGPNYISSWLHFYRDHARNPKPYHMGPKFGLPGSRLYLSPGRPGFKTTINADTRTHTHRGS